MCLVGRDARDMWGSDAIFCDTEELNPTLINWVESKVSTHREKKKFAVHVCNFSWRCNVKFTQFHIFLEPNRDQLSLIPSPNDFHTFMISPNSSKQFLSSKYNFYTTVGSNTFLFANTENLTIEVTTLPASCVNSTDDDVMCYLNCTRCSHGNIFSLKRNSFRCERHFCVGLFGQNLQMKTHVADAKVIIF